jgi:dsRNA-specific ribonuclease
MDSLIRDYIMRFSLVESRFSGQLLLSTIDQPENNKQLTVPALSDLPRIPLTKQEFSSLEKPFRDIQTLKKILSELNLSQFVQYVAFAQIYDPEQFHGISPEQGIEQLESLAHANVLRSILSIYYMHYGLEQTSQFFNEKIVPVAIESVQEERKETDFIHYPNKLKQFLLEQVKFEPEYRYIDVRKELEGTMEVQFSKRRSRAMHDIENQKKQRRDLLNDAHESLPVNEQDSLINFPNKYKLVCIGLYVNGNLVDKAISDSFTQAKHKVARQVYEDLTGNPLQMRKLREKLVNTEYVRSVMKVSKVNDKFDYQQ